MEYSNFKSVFNHEIIDYSKLEKPISLFNSWNKKEEFLSLCNKLAPEFLQKLKSHKFQTAGTFYAECHAFLSMCKMMDVDVILESGMARGNSTEIWARNFSGKIITFEQTKSDYHDEVTERLSAYDNVEVNFQDSNVGFVEKIKQYPKSRIAIFIDGPKDIPAVQLAMRSFEFENVLFAGIHDISNPITKCRPNYGFMRHFKYHVLSTDEPSYRENFSYLDDEISDNSGAWVYNESGVSELSLDPKAILKRFPNGPGIGMAINHNLVSESDFT